MSEDDKLRDFSKELIEIRNRKMAYLNKRRDEINKEVAEAQRKIRALLDSKDNLQNNDNKDS